MTYTHSQCAQEYLIELGVLPSDEAMTVTDDKNPSLTTVQILHRLKD